MNLSDLCSDCRSLLSSQRRAKHERLIEKSHMMNFTIFQCAHCKALLEQSEAPSSWQLLPIPIDKQPCIQVR